MINQRLYGIYRMFLLMALVLQVSAMLLPGIVSAKPDDHSAVVQSTMTASDDDHDEREEKEESPYQEVFNWVGKLSVILGAFSLSWVMMKRKRVSKVIPVRKMANLFYRLHRYTGWTAFVLIVAHGAYYIIFEWFKDEMITGLLAFVTLVALVGYGILLSRRRLPHDRRVHFGVAIFWVVMTVIHALDAIPLLLFVIGLSYGLIWWFERRSLQKA
jgi:hypothetical protein